MFSQGVGLGPETPACKVPAGLEATHDEAFGRLQHPLPIYCFRSLLMETSARSKSGYWPTSFPTMLIGTSLNTHTPHT